MEDMKLKYTKNNYKRWILKATHDEILKEYNKLTLLLAMMKHKGPNSIAPYPKKDQKRDNITIIKYKYNILCQEITNRNYTLMDKNYKKRDRYKSL